MCVYPLICFFSWMSLFILHFIFQAFIKCICLLTTVAHQTSWDSLTFPDPQAAFCDRRDRTIQINQWHKNGRICGLQNLYTRKPGPLGQSPTVRDAGVCLPSWDHGVFVPRTLTTWTPQLTGNCTLAFRNRVTNPQGMSIPCLSWGDNVHTPKVTKVQKLGTWNDMDVGCGISPGEMKNLRQV